MTHVSGRSRLAFGRVPFVLVRLSVLLIAAAALSTATYVSAKDVRRPNVILIMADDLGFECLRCNGGLSYDSSRLDKLASQGMRFTNCYSQPICTPSRNKIMTGRSNARNYKSFGLLVRDEVTFGNIMKQAGYKTAVAGKWQLTGGDPSKGATPETCGFEESCMWAYKHNLPPGVVHTGGWEKKNIKTSRFWHPCILENGRYRPTKSDDYGPDIYTDFLIDFIKRNKDNEFFAYYPMALTHGPFLPTPHSDAVATANKFKSNGRYFGDMIAYTGFCVERITKTLEQLGIAENTLVIFTTDNGTGRSLTSKIVPPFADSTTRQVPGGKGLTVDAGCHVPMIARWKGKIAPGSTCNDLVDFSDFLPTIAELGKAQLAADHQLDGRSFLPQLLGEKGNPRTSVFVHYDKSPDKANPGFRRVRFAYDGSYKLYSDGQMFNVPFDWQEIRPIDMATATDDAKAARKKLQAKLDEMPAWKPDNSAFGDDPDKATQAWRSKAALN